MCWSMADSNIDYSDDSAPLDLPHRKHDLYSHFLAEQLGDLVREYRL